MRQFLGLVLTAASVAACGDGEAPSTTDGPGVTATNTSGTDGPTTPTTGTPEEPTTGATGTSAGEGAGEGTGTTTGTSTGEPDPPLECSGPVQQVRFSQPSALLVIDRSARMLSQMWDHDGDAGTPMVTHWRSVHAAVDGALSLQEGRIAVGSELYPGPNATVTYDETACVLGPDVTVPAVGNSREEILAGMPAADVKSLQGAWPVAAALTVAREHLVSLAEGAPRMIVLIAGGLPACSADAVDNMSLFEVYDEDAPAAAEAAFAAGIPVHVIALAASDADTGTSQDANPNSVTPSQKFAALAAKGGTGQFTNAKNEAQIAAALGSALATLPDTTCVLPLTTEVNFPNKARVEIGGMEVARVEGCAGEDGWRFTTDQPPFAAIELCGAACETLRERGEATLIDCTVAPG